MNSTQSIQGKAQTPPALPQTQGFTFEEEKTTGAAVLTVYGPKGEGKTSLLMGLSGKKYFLSFDDKTMRIKESRYKNDPDVVVYNAMRYFDEELEKMPASGWKTYEYVKYLLNEIKKKGDAAWVIIDYYPRFVKAMEQAMRHKNNLTAQQAFANLKLWDVRNSYMANVHELALEATVPQSGGKKHGLAYSTYIGEQVTEKKDGETFSSRKKPKYQDYAEEKTDTIMYAERSETPLGGSRFTVKVESNKFYDFGGQAAQGTIGSVKDGTTIDLTGGKRIRDIITDL